MDSFDMNTDRSKVLRLEAENARLREELAKWTRVFGHLGTADECGNEWIALKEELAAAHRARKQATKEEGK